MAVEPIRHEFDVDCTPEQAFALYTKRIGEWWPAEYSADPETLRAVTIEGRVGGRVFATHAEDELTWGRITAWEPGRELGHTFTLAQDAEQPTDVSVRFAPSGDGCHVRFEHGGWDEGNLADRAKFSDWPVILDRFAELANRKAG